MPTTRFRSRCSSPSSPLARARLGAAAHVRRPAGAPRGPRRRCAECPHHAAPVGVGDSALATPALVERRYARARAQHSVARETGQGDSRSAVASRCVRRRSPSQSRTLADKPCRRSRSPTTAPSPSSSTTVPCSEWEKAVLGRNRASRGANSRFNSIAVADWTRWSRVGRATRTDRAIRSRCSSAPRDGECSSRRPGCRSIYATRCAVCSSRGSRPCATRRRRRSAISSRPRAKDYRRPARSCAACTTSSSSTRTIRPR